MAVVLPRATDEFTLFRISSLPRIIPVVIYFQGPFLPKSECCGRKQADYRQNQISKPLFSLFVMWRGITQRKGKGLQILWSKAICKTD